MRHRTTHKASWIDRSASCITNLLLPRTMILTVRPGFVIPEIFTIRLPLTFTSSTNSAVERLSATKWSKLAIGRQPKVLEINSMSSLSISFIVKIFTLSKKCWAKSLNASLKYEKRLSLHTANHILQPFMRLATNKTKLGLSYLTVR